MIQRLQWKFVAILMTIVTLLLVITFVALYYSTKINYRQRSMDALHAAVMEERSGERPHGKLPPPRREELPILVADVAFNGSITVVKNRLLDISSEEAEGLISLAKEKNTPSGLLKEQHLRFLCEKKGRSGTTRYAFADIYAEQSSLHWQIIHSSLIGSCSFSAFFLFSVLLSRWAVRPVADAWDRQRQFVADASHELKTPLTVILSNADMLMHAEDIPGDKNRQRIGHIQAEAARMKQLVESLLTLARSDSGSPQAEHKPLDFSFIVNSSAMTFEPYIFDLGKSISCRIEEQIQVDGDKKQLRQLVDILLDNACKYSTEAGAITIELSKNGTKEALLSVTNEGIPLTKEEICHIFLRFYRADPARSGSSGYGLGLAIAKSIAAEHAGKVEVKSDGVGKNCFTVRLPLYRRPPLSDKTSQGQADRS